ncbi:MAG TPA: bacillithiol biosynthesis cysteine-adding enzyme BshC [Candidatus Sulfotelmatobacter sp.]
MKAKCLPFSQIPHTTPLFNDFISYSPKVQSFYPRSPYFREWMKEEALAVRGDGAYDRERRARVAEILERQSKNWNASPATIANLSRFRAGSCAVVTGQQVGLFGGPMFSVYKALTAVKLAEEATAAGVDTVPVFWLATYDHDLAEVNHVAIPGAEGMLQTLSITSHDSAGAPVSAVRLGEEILTVVEHAAGLLGDSEATQWLRESYSPGETLGSAFARLYSRLFAEWGVIILDASDPELHKIAEPIYRAAAERAPELADALLERGKSLEAAGYHQQVKVTKASVLLFTLQNGARVPIQRKEVGSESEFVIGQGETAEKVSREELLRRIAESPEKFSPNVLLRPIVQDYLLPTLAYTGGAAEASYFAQAAAVYEKLSGSITPIVPRFSATLVEPKIQRLLQKHGLSEFDVFQDPNALRQRLAAKSLPKDLQDAFDAATTSVTSIVTTIREKLGKLDPTLAEAAQTAESKMQYQLDRLKTQAAKAELRLAEVLGRHADTLSQSLYPDKGLQERAVGGVYFVARYGTELLRQLHDAVQPDCHNHQVVEL